MKHYLTWMFIGACLATGSLWAQSQVGGATINGTVSDPSSSVISDAKVTVTNTGTGFTRSTQTSDGGLFVFSAIPVGTYDLVVEKQGFKSTKFPAVSLNVGSVITLDAKLEVGQVAETVSVTAETPIVETTSSQVSTTVNSAAVSELPVNGRNFLDFTLLTPGVVRDPSRTGDLSFGGQRGTANSVQIDGADSNNTFFGQALGRTGTGRNPYSFSQDSVQEFQVATNTYAAELGRAGGAVINVVTKSGTNEFHGTGYEFFRDKGLNANSWENNRANRPRRDYHYNQFGGTIGGPIKKDKAFFFFSYDGQRNAEPINVILGVAAPSDALSQQARAELLAFTGGYPRKLDNNVYLGKVDLNLTDRQRLSVRVNSNRFVGLNYENSGVTSALGHTGNASVTTDNIAGNHTFVINPAVLLESRVAYTRDNQPGEANSTAPEAVILQGNNAVITIGRNNFSPRYTNAKTMQWAESLSYVRGRHSYKMGLDFIFQRIDNFFPGLFSGAYQFNSYAAFASRTPSSYRQAFAGANTDGPLTKPNVNEFAFFVQDSWRTTSRLTLNYGIRYDLFGYAQPSVQNPNAALLAQGLDTSRINRDRNNLAARFGFAYRLSDSGNLTLRGGYGNFYGRTPSIMTGTAMSQNGIQVQTYSLSANFPVYPNILAAPPALNRTPDIYVFAKDYVQPLTHQFSLQLERQFGRDYSIQIGYNGTRGVHLSRTRDINLLPVVPVAGTLAGAPVTYLRHPGRVNSAFGRISVFDSGADLIYHGGFIQVNKRMSKNIQVLASYTLAKAIDSRPDSTSVVVGTDDSKNAFDTLNPNAERGRGNADIRHRFVGSGIWNIDYAAKLSNPILRTILRGYQLSPVLNMQSGRPLTATVGSDPNNDGNTATDRPFGIGRNTYEGPGLVTLDLRISRDIRIYKERVSLKLMGEAFNLTNRVNFLNLNTGQYSFASGVFTPTTNFLQPTTTYDPRILQLGARLTF